MDVQKLELWWNVVIGTAVALSIAAGFVSVLIFHTRSRLRIQREKIAAIEESRKEYIDLFDSVSDIVYVHDLDGVILKVNRSAGTVLGLPVEAIVGRTLADIVPRGASVVVEYLRDLASESGDRVGIVPIWSPAGGGIKVFEYRSTIVPRDGGNPVVRGTARDITDRLRHERGLEKSRLRINALLRREQMMQAKLAEFSQETLRMQEEERLWVSRELHDEFGQYLASVLFNLEVIKNGIDPSDEKLRRRVEEAKKVASGMLDRVRAFLRRLRPPAIQELGLAAALQAMVAEVESRTGLTVEYFRDARLEVLDYDQKVNLYRVIQECLSNVVKHARATSASIRIQENDGRLDIVVRDNGVGFDATTLHAGGGGLGLIGMRERLALARGELRIESAPGKGTAVHIVFSRSVSGQFV